MPTGGNLLFDAVKDTITKFQFKGNGRNAAFEAGAFLLVVFETFVNIQIKNPDKRQLINKITMQVDNTTFLQFQKKMLLN